MKVTLDNYVPTKVEREIAPEHVEAFRKLRNEVFLSSCGIINIGKTMGRELYRDYVDLCDAYGVDASLPEARVAFFRALCEAL